MKTNFLIPFAVVLFLFALPADGASDTDVTIIKAEKVLIEEDKITIIAEATISVIAISGDHDPGYKGFARWGRPAARVQIKSDKATFVIKRPRGPEEGWEMTLEAANELKKGNPVGRIGYYRPTVIISQNTITSIEGFGFLYPKGK